MRVNVEELNLKDKPVVINRVAIHSFPTRRSSDLLLQAFIYRDFSAKADRKSVV